MSTSKQLANHIHQVYFGGNWTTVNLKDTLTDVSLETAKTKIEGFNTILALTFHIHYYLKGITKVLEGGALEIKDKFSYQHPELRSSAEWDNLLERIWDEAEEFSVLISKFPDSKWDSHFTEEKYGNYFRNILGLIEHTHYHLGQIVILKKLISKSF